MACGTTPAFDCGYQVSNPALNPALSVVTLSPPQCRLSAASARLVPTIVPGYMNSKWLRYAENLLIVPGVPPFFKTVYKLIKGEEKRGEIYVEITMSTTRHSRHSGVDVL